MTDAPQQMTVRFYLVLKKLDVIKHSRLSYSAEFTKVAIKSEEISVKVIAI